MGASVDFLTPFGHHNNTLVMGLGNYRFADFCKAGWPVALAASGVGLAFIVLVWAN
jgi:di/tricarboxylate transporter